MTLRRLALVAALSTAGFLSAQGTLKRGVYEDSQRGFKVSVPPKWTQVPTQAGRKWVVAQFQSPKEYEGHHKLDDSFLHKPLMRVILFDHKEIKERYEAETGETGETEKEKEKARPELPYKDYTDYCTRSLKKGAWVVDLKQPAREGDLQVTRFQRSRSS